MVRSPGPGGRPHQPTLGRSFATVLAVVCVGAALSACGEADGPGGRIALLPNTETTGAWDWTSACRVGPRGATGCEAAGPNLGPAQLAGNAWNLGGGPETTGAVRMSVDASGALVLNGHLSSAPPCTDPTCIAPEANTWVRGYPSILYGIDQCNAHTSPPQSRELELPVRVDSIPSGLIGSAAYEAETSLVTYTIAYDLWLNASNTKTPCRTDGTLEVMVWTDYDAQSLLPDELRVGTASVPLAVDGVADPGEAAWSVYVNNVYGEGRTAPWGGTVWLVLDEAHTVASGSVSVDLSAALAEVGTLLEDRYGWRDVAGTYWLDTIAFGVEFGPENADPYGAGPTAFAVNVTAYCLAVRTTVSAAAC